MKINNNYRTLTKIDNIEWCLVIKNINKVAKTNRYIKPIIKDFKTMVPQLFDPCPFVGEFKMINVGSPEHLMSILPTAEFSVKVKIKDIVQNGDVSTELKFIKHQ